MGSLRTAGAGALRAGHAGDEVRLAGWVSARRDHGGIVFVDLRDASGVAQVVIDPERSTEMAEIAQRLRDEYCIAVAGTVRPRPEGMVNPEMATGEIEVEAASIEVLSPAAPLPFTIDDRIEADEVNRLRHRYLDLRRPRMAANLRARSGAIRAMRRSLEDQGFLEVETPTLIKSTPEGARDFLVPSRLRKGTFYALPQSPQLFKQLLMVGGVERYYQIARCYRDEDFRADRQVEFTQLDLEGAFWEEDDVFAALEAVMAGVVAELRGAAVEIPFPRLTYAEAMARYGTDKPDIRFGMEIVEVTDVFAGSEFRAFAGVAASDGLVAGIDAGPLGLSRAGMDALVESAKVLGAKGLVWIVVEDDGSLRSPVAKFLGEAERDALIAAFGAEPGDVLLLAGDEPRVVRSVLGALRLDVGKPAGHDELRFLWVTDFPVFEVQEDGTLAAAHHAFTSPVDVVEMEERPETALSRAYDLVLNGSELGSGSIRIHDPEIQARVFKVLGIADEEARSRFGWFLEALRYGTPPHGGFAVGIDRLVSILQGESNIREVIPFPKTQTGFDPLTESPAPVAGAQLAELGIEVSAAARAELEEDGRPPA